MEERVLLTSGREPFAILEGVLEGSSEVHTIQVDRGDFGLGTRQAIVEMRLVAPETSGEVTIGNVSRVLGGRVARAEVLGRSSDSIRVVFQPGVFHVEVVGANAVNGQADAHPYTIEMRLVGDVDNQGGVNANDLRDVRSRLGSRAGSVLYDPSADVNQDGRINLQDYRLTRRSLGADATLTPLTQELGIEPADDPNGDNVVTSESVTLIGRTRPNSLVVLDRGADGQYDEVLFADAEGKYAQEIFLAPGENAMAFIAVDRFGQLARNTQRIQRIEATAQGGIVLQSAGPLLDFYQVFDGDAKATSTIGGTSYVVENFIYAVPGTDPLNAGTPDINAAYIPNSSSTFNQAVQSNDWWTNLMFRIDPSTYVDPLDPNVSVQLGYANAEMYSEPGALRLENGALGKLNPLRGVSIFSPTVLFEDQVTDPASQIPWPVLSAPAYTPAVSLVVDGLEPISTDAMGRQALNARVNSYSDWGVEIGYSNATDSMTVDMLSGSPFTYFQKTGPAALKLAVQGSTPDATKTVISTFETGDPTILGFRLEHHVSSATVGGNQQDQVSYYLVMTNTETQGAEWSTFDTDNRTYTIYSNPIGDATIVVATLPMEINGQAFDALSAADKQAVAQYFKSYAFNIPTGSQVSDPTSAYDVATGLVNSTLSVATNTSGPTLQVVYPHQWRNLVTSDLGNLEHTVPGFSPGTGPLEMTWTTPRGTSKLYLGNQFTTSLDYRGTIPFLPPTAISDPGTANTLYQQLAGWYQYRFGQAIDSPQTPNLGSLAGPLLNTYALEFTLISDTIRLADQLVASTSPLTATQKANLTRMRDWLLDSIRTLVSTYFDIASGKLMHLNQTYDTVIGYPAGFGSDLNLNDHHFHYGYFLNAFAALTPFDPEFVQSYQGAIEWLVADVANVDRTRTDVPFLRNFSPWAGHSFADGLGRGGNNQESSSEAMQFASGLIQLGEFFNNAAWRNLGVYLHTTEAEAIQNYWLNAYAYDSNGQFDASQSNWPATYAQGAGKDPVTQIAVVRQNLTSQATLFGGKIDARYAINWVPANASAMYLVSDAAYAGVNWNQFASDYTTDNLNGQGGYELATSIYQSLIGSNGMTGPLAPGSAGALQRIAAFPGANGNRYEDGYLGTSVPLASAFASTMGTLGRYDSTIQANTPYYAVFVNSTGTRTYLVYVPENALNPTTSVMFKDSTGTVIVIKPISGSGLFTFVGDSTTPSLYQIQPSPRISEGALYLTNDVSAGTLGLSTQAGTTGPNLSQTYAVPSLSPYAQAGQFTTIINVPPRDPNADGNSNARPVDASRIAAFVSGPLSGTYDANVNNGQTLLELFMNQYLEPGVIQNQKVAGHNMLVRVMYNPTAGDNPTADRIEEYTVILDSANRYVVVNENSSVVPVSITGSFPATLSQVRIEIWGGAFPSDPAFAPFTNRNVALSVNTPVPLGRSSRIGVPYDFS